MNWQKIEEENAVCVEHERRMYRTHAEASAARGDWQSARTSYARSLKAALSRQAHRIAKENSSSWCVKVMVSPMVNHTDKTAAARAELRWANHGIELRMSALLRTDADVQAFLKRFEATLKIHGK
jgi:hypothetical protein